ncbi:MAG: FAD-dependent oxidoreductase [Terrimonas sp.]|nr:FAD-dependent oxidoreductase [Terrimonas sp.]
MGKILVVGGGVIGLSCAYYLEKAGYEVTVLDNTGMDDGASYGNAGHVVPSHFVPLAAPGIVAQGLRWMLNASSPFYIKPRWNTDLFRWGLQFWRSSGADTMKRNIPDLHRLLSFSRELFEDWQADLGNSFSMTSKGILIAYKTPESERHEAFLAAEAGKMGLHARILSAREVQDLESSTVFEVRGGVLYEEDAHLQPGLLMASLKKYLDEKGVTLLSNTAVQGFQHSGNRIHAVLTDSGEYFADEFVLANGAWMPALAGELGINLLMQGGKGYSITYKNFLPQLQYPAILVDHRVVTTPMGNNLRLAGTMEINGLSSPIMPKRVNAIVASVKSYYPELDLRLNGEQVIWSGIRPLSPDGLPYIGRPSNYENCVMAGGHAMLGLSLATGTGKLVEEIISHKKLSLSTLAFSPERF